MEIKLPPSAFGIMQFTYIPKEQSLYKVHEGYAVQAGLLNLQQPQLKFRFKYPGMLEAIPLELPLFSDDYPRDGPMLLSCKLYKIEERKVILEGKLHIPNTSTNFIEKWHFTGTLRGNIPATLPVWDCMM